MAKKSAKCLLFFWAINVLAACSSGSLRKGSSEPINDKEALLYHQELIRCNKTGGTRVVKIKGKIHCF